MPELFRHRGHLHMVVGHVLEEADEVDLLLVFPAERAARVLSHDRDDRLVVGLGVARRITRPVARLIAVTRAMASGDRSARAGEITAGAWADLLLIDGDPTADLSLLADPGKNMLVIVKDGVIAKNTL